MSNPFEDIFGANFNGAQREETPKSDPKAEANRLAREWRRLSNRMQALWPDEKAS